MYRTILVPLDGSELAECVLPHVKTLATGCGIKDIILLEVIEQLPVRAAEGADIEAIQQQRMKDAQAYLAKIRESLASEGHRAKAEVLLGQAAETIVEFATHNADLIAIATHGRSGVSRWVYGSVADKVLRSCHIPVLLVRAPGCKPGV